VGPVSENVAEPGLTKTEERIIAALLNPDNKLLTVAEICNIAKCSDMTYYRAFRKDYFKEEYKKRTNDLIMRSVGPIVATYVRRAIEGSHQHGNVLLQMADMYKEKHEHELDFVPIDELAK
jgi:DNA-binding transcriptional regulator YhcF (GntR family)